MTAWPVWLVTRHGSDHLHVAEYPEGTVDGWERAACGSEGPSRVLPAHLTILGRVRLCQRCRARSAAARRLQRAIDAGERRWTATTSERGL